MKWGEAGEDMTRGRPSRAAEGERGGGREGGGKGLWCTVLYSIHRTHTKLHVYKQGGGGWGPASRHTASWSANSEASTPS